MSAKTRLYTLLAMLGLAAPWLGLYPVFLMKLLCFAMFACAFNLLLGYTKMLSFGHAAYFGSSAYVTGWLVTALGWGTVAGILGGVAVALLLGLVMVNLLQPGANFPGTLPDKAQSTGLPVTNWQTLLEL